MARGKKSPIMVMVLTCVILMGYAIDGVSEETSATPQSSAVKPLTPQQPFRRLFTGLEVVADLAVSPPTYTGPCPAVFTIKGSIYANKPIAIQYLLRVNGTPVPPRQSNGTPVPGPQSKRPDTTKHYFRIPGTSAPLPVEILEFEAPGKKEVTHVWNLNGGTGLPPFNGLAKLEILWPVNVESNAVFFTGSCTGGGPSLTGAAPGQPGGPQPQPGPGVPGAQPGPQGSAPGNFPGQPAGPQGSPSGVFPNTAPGNQGPIPGVSPGSPSGPQGSAPANFPVQPAGPQGPLPGAPIGPEGQSPK